VALLPIETARLRLRPLHGDDLDALAEIYLHPLVTRWIGRHTRADVAREIAQQVGHQGSLGFSLWALEERTRGRLMIQAGFGNPRRVSRTGPL
jgi:RimJ/RimL family protein N-acetyltransferase